MSLAEWDTHELVELEMDLSRAPLRIQFGAAREVESGARILDRIMTEDARGHQGNWFGIAGTEYDTPLEDHVSHEMIGPLEAEIGIEMKGAGKLAHIIALGSVNNAPAYDPYLRPRAAAGRVAAKFGDMAERAVLGDRA